MWHDFDKRHGGDGRPGTGGACEGKGTMSYGENSPSRWSECSRRDFQAHYNQGPNSIDLSFEFWLETPYTEKKVQNLTLDTA